MATRLRALLDSARPLAERLFSRLPEPLSRRLGPLADRLRGPQAEPPIALQAADIPPPPPLIFADVLAWTKSSGRSVRFRSGDDHLEVSTQGLRLEVAPDSWVAVSPRLALPTHGDLPAIRAQDLVALAEGSPFSKVFKLDIGPPTAWDTVAAAIPAGDGNLLGDAGILLRQGTLPPEAAAQALEQAREGEPLDMALSRLGVVNLDSWLEALVGKQWLLPPASRPFGQRIGMRLLAGHTISQGQLKQALGAQAAAGPHRLLGQILGIPDVALRKLLEDQKPSPTPFPEADSLGECLIRWGCVSRTDWVAAQRAGPDAAGTLVKAGKLLASHVARANTYREALGRHYAARTIRLGQVLVERGLDREALAKALACQVDQPLPLAELMLLHRLLAPGEAARALGQQAARYRILAETGLPPLEPKVRPAAAAAIAPSRPTRPRRPFPRQAYALAVFGIFCLTYALAFGARQRGVDYGWFNAFFPQPAQTPALYRAPGGTVHEVSESRRLKRPAAVQQVDRLDMPFGRVGLEAASGATAEFGPRQEAVGLGGPGPRGKPGATADLDAVALRGLVARGLPAPGVATSVVATGLERAQAIPSLGPARRFPAPTLGDLRPAEALAEPSFPPLTARRPGGEDGPDSRFSYPMEQAVSLATPAPRAAGNRNSPSGSADEPAAMRRFRGDLARLRATEARHRQRGRDLREGGQEDAARRELTAAENVRRSQAVFRARIGQAYLREGDRVAAAAELKGAVHDDPTFALPHFYLATIATTRGDRQGAIAHFRSYLLLAPEGEFADESRKALIAHGEKVPAPEL